MPIPTKTPIQESLDAHQGGYWKLFVRRSGAGRRFYGRRFFRHGRHDAGRHGAVETGNHLGLPVDAVLCDAGVLGLAIGLPLHAFAAWRAYRRGFDPIDIAWITATYNPGRLAMAVATSAW